MKFQREEFLKKLLKFAPEKPKAAKLSNSNPIPSGEIFSRERWIQIEGFLIPLNHIAAILKESEEKEFAIYQGKKGIAVKIGNLKIYFSQRGAKEEERKEKVFSLPVPELLRIKKFLKCAQSGKDEKREFCQAIQFKNEFFTLTTGTNVIQGKTSVQENVILSREIFKRVKAGQKGEIEIYKEDILTISFPDSDVGGLIQEAKIKNIYSCFLDIPETWKGSCWIDFEKKSIYQIDQENGFENERKNLVQAPFIKGKLGVNLDHFPIKGKIEVKISRIPYVILYENEEFLLISMKLKDSSERFEVVEEPEKREEKSKFLKIDQLYFEEKTSFCFVFAPKEKKKTGSTFKKIVPDKIEKEFFYFEGKKFDKFSGKEFLEGYDLAALRRNFFEIYGKSPKYRAFSLIP